MSLFSFDRKQVWNLVIVFSDAVMPIWRMIPLGAGRRSKKPWNPILLLFLLILVFVLSSWSVYPGVLIYVPDSGLTFSNTGAGLSLLIARTKLITFILLELVIVATFIVDMKDAVMSESIERFIYDDPNTSRHATLWWSLSILLLGYLARLFFFTFVGLLAMEAANTASIASTGISMFHSSNLPGPLGGVSNQLIYALNTPLLGSDLGKGGSSESIFFLLSFGTLRQILVTFFVGVFYVVLPKLSGSGRRPARAH